MIEMFAVPTFEAFEEKIGLNARQISMLLISISIILWSVSMLFSKMEIGSYGLINGINPLFFVSSSILIVSLFMTINKNIEDKLMLILHLIIIILIFSSVPALIEGTARFPYNYQTAQNVNFILQFGHSDPQIIHYQSWPGVFYFGSIETLISGISSIDSLLIIPLIFVIVNLLLSYLLFSTFLNKKETWMALLISNVLLYSSSIYLLPGVIGLMMITFALFLFFKFDLFEKRASFAIRIIFIIFCGAAVVSHFLNSVYLFMTLAFIAALSFIMKKNIDRKFILVFVLIAAFQLYVAGSYALDTVSGSVHDALNLEKTVNDVKNMAYSGSQSHTDVVNVRIISTLLLVILAAIGFFYEFLYRKRINFRNISLITWIGANLSVSSLTSYSGEIINRTFAASINVLYILAAKVMDNRKLSILLVIILIIAPPISIINAYGNEATDYVSPVEISGVNFLISNSVNSSVIESLKLRIWALGYKNLTWITIDPEKNIEMINTENFKKLYKEIFILNGKRDKEDYNFLSETSDFNQLNDLQFNRQYNKIFDNNGFELYQTRGI